MRDMGLDLIEYLAVLISPSPKDTIKAIDHRRSAVEREKIKSGEIKVKSDEHKLFKKDHRNTTFYDDIAKFGGNDAAEALKKEFGEEGQVESTESYEMDMEDLEFIEKARQAQADAHVKEVAKEKLDTIEF